MDSGFFMQNEPNSGSSRPRQPIPPSNIQSRVPGDQRPTTEFTDTHRKENSDQPCLSVSFPGATPAHRVGSFRGYPLVMILLAAVKAWPTLDRVAQTGAEWNPADPETEQRVSSGCRRMSGGWRVADGGWRMAEAKWRMAEAGRMTSTG